MKSLIFTSRLSFLIIIFLATACKKDRSLNDQNEGVYSVSFKLSGFTSQVYPLQNGVNKMAKLASSSTSTSSVSTDYLYFWSFNDREPVPDITFHPSSTPTISYIDGLDLFTFVASTYKFEDFVGGFAISFTRGATEILIKMPLPIGTQLNELGFDVGSPNTGPKDFEIYYSLDQGDTFEVLQLNNQFEDPGEANKKHSYLYDLDEVTLGTKGIWFKVAPKAGERDGAGIFSEGAGNMRMDNLRITGTPPSSDLAYDEVHYFIFSKENDELLLSGTEDLAGLSTIELSLPAGDYHISFISNASDQELLFPSTFNLQNFYVSNIFSNAHAEIFGYTGDLNVSEDQTVSVELKRLYSQVTVEFTDLEVLENVSKLEIEQVHSPFFYAPFNPTMANPITDASTILFIDDFVETKQIEFHQFMGQLEEPETVSYLLRIYVDDELVRTVELENVNLKNNMKLVFKGPLFINLELGNSFQIVKNVSWDDEIEVAF